MNKRILITGGPTNEYIDEVMKITNMSTGKLAVNLAKYFADKGCKVTLVCTRSVARSGIYYDYELAINPLVNTIQIETTEDMLKTLKYLSGDDYDMVIHSAAVGDYKPEFTFKMEDMAKELAEYIAQLVEENYQFLDHPDHLQYRLLNVLTNPKCKVNDDTKISSYEPNLTVKLGLTPKIISHLKEWYPHAKLIGFKLLENVQRDHLIEVATKLCNKNDMDYIIANDLHDLRQGTHISYLCDKKGYAFTNFYSAKDIAQKLEGILNVVHN